MNGKFRVAGAVLLAVVLVASAFVFRDTEPPSNAGTVVATAPSREYIKPVDSDDDGVKDWEEELAGRNDFARVSFSGGTTTAFEEPDTLTGEFAISFFEEYMSRAMNGTINEQNLDSFLGAEIGAIEQQSRDDLITRSDIQVGTDDSFAAVRAYGNAVAEILHTYGSVEEEIDNEVVILERSLKASDPSILEELDPIIAGYEDMLHHTKKLTVPPSLADEHVLLLNAYQAILNDIIAMQNTMNDPIASMLRLKRYRSDADALLSAYLSIARRLQEHRIEYADDEPGVLFGHFNHP